MTTFLTRRAARSYLTEVHGIELGVAGLENMASDGTGPHYAKIAGRAVYTREWLDTWVKAEAARPVVRRRKRGSADQNAVT